MLNKNKYLALVIALAALAGCKQVPMLPGLGAHKIDIQQGNAITQEMVAKLQPGMTRNQVRFVLGTPLLVDPFRADRWDYYYSYMKGGDLVEQRRFAVFFKDDKLERVEGDVIPAKPAADKPVADKPSEPVKPAAVKSDANKPQVAVPVKPAEAPAAPATLTTGDGTPIGSTVGAVADKPAEKPAGKIETKAEAKVEAKPAAPKPEVKAEEKPKEERGFFGRMLERIGL